MGTDTVPILREDACNRAFAILSGGLWQNKQTQSTSAAVIPRISAETLETLFSAEHGSPSRAKRHGSFNQRSPSLEHQSMLGEVCGNLYGTIERDAFIRILCSSD